jgi:hypothetical protein
MNLLKSWGFMRVLRFIFGAFALVQAIITLDIVLGILGLVVGGMAFFNVGCCGAKGCETDYKKDNTTKQITDVEYEEVVTK